MRKVTLKQQKTNFQSYQKTKKKKKNQCKERSWERSPLHIGLQTFSRNLDKWWLWIHSLASLRRDGDLMDHPSRGVQGNALVSGKQELSSMRTCWLLEKKLCKKIWQVKPVAVWLYSDEACSNMRLRGVGMVTSIRLASWGGAELVAWWYRLWCNHGKRTGDRLYPWDRGGLRAILACSWPLKNNSVFGVKPWAQDHRIVLSLFLKGQDCKGWAGILTDPCPRSSA